jgi:hypothetical protein
VETEQNSTRDDSVERRAAVLIGIEAVVLIFGALPAALPL